MEAYSTYSTPHKQYKPEEIKIEHQYKVDSQIDLMLNPEHKAMKIFSDKTKTEKGGKS